MIRYKFARSNISGKAPTLARLPVNEMAVNTADKTLYFNTGTQVIKIAGHTVHNAAFTIDFSGSLPIVTVPFSFVPRSTRLYVGGQRQMLDNDYEESDDHTLTLAIALTEEAFNSGGNTLVLDVDPA